MPTARQIIKKSLQKIGVLVKGEEPSADEANDALDSLNQLIQSWSNDSAVIPSRAWETFTLTSGVSTYTMGVGQTFNTSRPTNIIAGYTRNGSIDTMLTVIGDESYNSISFKALTGIPQFLNYDNANPVDNLRLYPVPVSAYPIFLLTEKPLVTISTLDTTIDLPPGYERALIYNLAAELAPEYGQAPDQSIFKIAAESLGMIRLSSIRARSMDAYPQIISSRNVWSGYRY
jgi:hypothetical protein